MSDLNHGLRPYRRTATYTPSDVLRLPALDAAVQASVERQETEAASTADASGGVPVSSQDVTIGVCATCGVVIHRGACLSCGEIGPKGVVEVTRVAASPAPSAFVTALANQTQTTVSSMRQLADRVWADAMRLAGDHVASDVMETKVTHGYREVGIDWSRRPPGWDDVETHHGGVCTEGWASARAVEASLADGKVYEVVRREIRYTAWEVVE